MELPLELDLRGLGHDRRRTLALNALNALRPGEAVVFVTDCLPRELVADLGGEARGNFDFAALEQTEEAHTLEVRRHAPERDLLDIIASEHHRIDRLLTEVEWRLSQRLFQEAGQRFGQLRVALQYHMLMEDQLLFPAYDRSHGSAAAILTLRREHDIMRTLLAQVGLGLRKESEESRSAVRALADLRELFDPTRGAKRPSWRRSSSSPKRAGSASNWTSSERSSSALARQGHCTFGIEVPCPDR